jgi:hypothetical protein
MDTHIDRRTVLATGVAMVITAPALATTDPDAHIHRLAETFTQAWDAAEVYPGELEDPEFEAFMDTGNGAYYEIMEAEPQTIAGLEAKYRTFHRWISGSMVEQHQIDVFAVDLKRMAGNGGSLS